MFVRNRAQEDVIDPLTKKPIYSTITGQKERRDCDVGPITFEGYEFVLPAKSVCAVWPAFYDYLQRISNLMKVESREPGTGGLPPLFPATEEEWDGSYAHVTRFRIDHSRIPNRNDLVRLAEQYGVDKEFVARCRIEGSAIESEEIAAAINALPVPEHIRIPVKKKKI